jgi:5-methylcytosine-specific restriction endonuclease McrA
MSKKEKICCKCGSIWVVNKTKSLCFKCNDERLHPGGKEKKSINNPSKKRQRIILERKSIYEKVDIREREICSGCNQLKPYSHSHIIPISVDKSLENKEENITLHCMSCHKKWESHDINQMKQHLDYEKNIEYIKKVRPDYYYRLMSKLKNIFL